MIMEVSKICQNTLLTMKILAPETGSSIPQCPCLLELIDLPQMHKYVHILKKQVNFCISLMYQE